MTEFERKFLAEDLRRRPPHDGPLLHLGAFGKHPGWDDHIEADTRVPDLGLNTVSLSLAKTILYAQGIAGQVESGHWERLEPEQRLDTFGHVFVWQRHQQLLFGRMWSSTDGKGRSKYPMVVAAHGVGVPLEWVVEVGLRHLERLQQTCRAATTALDVGRRLAETRQTLHDALSHPTRSAPSVPEILATLFAQTGLGQSGAGHEGTYRILYQIQDQAGLRFDRRTGKLIPGPAVRPLELRLPTGGRSAPELLRGWSTFFRSLLDPSLPVLLIHPLGQPWVDALLAEPAPDQFFCLRVTTRRLPVASEVPFNLDPAFRTQAQHTLEHMLGRGTAPGREPGLSRFIGALGNLFGGSSTRS